MDNKDFSTNAKLDKRNLKEGDRVEYRSISLDDKGTIRGEDKRTKDNKNLILVQWDRYLFNSVVWVPELRRTI